MPTYQVAARQVWRSQECRNILYYDCADVLSAAQGQEVADAVRAAYSNLVNPNGQEDAWSLYGIDLRRVDVADLPGAFFQFTSGALVGVESSIKGMPNQIACVVSLQAPTTKPRRARMYVAGMSIGSWEDGGTFSGTYVGWVEDMVDDLDTITVTGDTLLRVAAQWSGSPPAVTATNRLQSYIVRDNPGTQRKRRIGTGI